MRKFSFLVLFLLGNIGFAQTTFEKWPAIKTFHEVISQTFHPAEEGNLEPIKSRSKELAQKAEAINKSEIPAEFKTKEIIVAAENLQIQSWALHKKIKLGATDEEILKMLTALHETFHQIVGLCTKEKH
ncbi:MAG: hypothetical protein CFE23_03170 [Flavobacterium sp. BFFFF1]|uniref:hypothetical protein n=1 Tax=Flavobacterium sp. BFFFF1 TaxID=2015557 RepID=UPI000BCDA262|nr:hypothetical protein [Flavobacterium sp. BFFFF1]OYU81889.1 MAG: hypothetical protein CFE23_03170 [Flavobacterium sp. BFFFF1]